MIFSLLNIELITKLQYARDTGNQQQVAPFPVRFTKRLRISASSVRQSMLPMTNADYLFSAFHRPMTYNVA
ncbi:MAG TPA: hypothetical protein DFK12_06050 [Gallionellaceae bacterium]|nr:hypothetical protein [Gallionellaceae bacterium]